jgi:hypothetical protein
LQNDEGLTFLTRLRPLVTIDSGSLPEADGRLLEALVRDARFFDLPARVPAPRGASTPTCHITIEDGGRRHSISVSEPVQGPALRRLVERLRELGGAAAAHVDEAASPPQQETVRSRPTAQRAR